jgi:FlaG/FlaF family flagellin (archaellin)
MTEREPTESASTGVVAHVGPFDTLRATVSEATGRLSVDRRGVSHVLGVVLVLAIVLTGIVSIVGFGVTGVSDTTTDISDTAVERDLTGFAQAVDRATVHSDTAAGTTTVDLSLTGVTESREWVETNADAGRLSLSTRANGSETELLNTSLGLVSYENPRSETRIAYQSGLVLSAPDATATPGVVRTNQFTHRTDGGVESLTLHITRVTGQLLADRRLDISARSAENLHPETLVGAGTGTPAEELVVRVDSTYSEGWELALRDVFPDDAEFTHTGDTLEVVYEVPDRGMFLHAYRHDVSVGGR